MSRRGRDNHRSHSAQPVIRDCGGEPMTADILHMARMNPFRCAAAWTGENLQLSLMSIHAGGESGLCRRPGSDLLLQTAGGRGLVKMGSSQYRPGVTEVLLAGRVTFIPAGVWYNIINVGTMPLSLCCISASPIMEFGEIQREREKCGVQDDAPVKKADNENMDHC